MRISQRLIAPTDELPAEVLRTSEVKRFQRPGPCWDVRVLLLTSTVPRQAF